MIHLKTSGRSVACKARGGYRTSDLWRVTCRKCLDVLEEIIYMENLRKKDE